MWSEVMTEHAEHTVSSISDDELLRRAVWNARGSRIGYRWVAVMEMFALGSTFSSQLCLRFGLEPDEIVRGRK